jgi:YD repeat-containing protein
VRGNISAVKEKLDATWVTTRYLYDPLSQITTVTDDKGNLTAVAYDQLGRRTAIDNPDTGLVEYECVFRRIRPLIPKETGH